MGEGVPTEPLHASVRRILSKNDPSVGVLDLLRGFSPVN